MLLENIGIHFISEHLVFGNIGVAIQANGIIVCHNISDFFFRTGVDFIGMRIMAHPAVKIIAVLG